MKKINLIWLTVLLALVSVSMALALGDQADEEIPCEFYGTITVNGDDNTFDTTTVTAYLTMSGENANYLYGINTTPPAGNYFIRISNIGSEIGFKISGVNADQEPVICESGIRTELDLTATLQSIIGSEEDMLTNLENLDVVVGGSTDLTQTYFGEQTVQFKEGEDVLVEFTFDFTGNQLNLTAITINKQDNTSETGGIEISGIDLLEGQTKTAYIDIINNKSYVCIKDEENAAISEMANDCAGDFSVACDGIETAEGYACTEEGSKLKITGLKHSAVTEYTPAEEEAEEETSTDDTTDTTTTSTGGGGGCSPYWTCEAWSECSADGTQTRECIILRTCGGPGPELVKECTPTIAPLATTAAEEQPEEVEAQPEETTISTESAAETGSVGVGMATGIFGTLKERWYVIPIFMTILGLLSVFGFRARSVKRKRKR